MNRAGTLFAVAVLVLGTSLSCDSSSSPGSGTAGRGGSAGAAGRGGVAGSATGGTGGATGSAGSGGAASGGGGSGGSVGSAGTSGQAGTGGTGTAGQSGASGGAGSTGTSGSGGAVAGSGGGSAGRGGATGGTSGGAGGGGRGGSAGNTGTGGGGRGGSGGSAGASGTGGGGGSGCASVHPNVSGNQRTCNPDRCYCAADDGCYLTAVAAGCCAGAIICVGTGGTTGAAGAGSGSAGRGGASGSGGSSGSAADDFERASLGPNWTIAYPTSGNQVQIIDNSDVGMVPGPEGFFLLNWIGSSVGADQYSEVVIAADATPGWAYQPYVRWRASDRARYGFGLDNDPGQTQYYNKWYFKYDGVAGSETRMFGLADNTTGRQPGPGDTLRVEIRGYTLYGYWNGQLMTTATDTAANRIANGVPGLAARVANGNQAITQPAKVWESWAGGSLSP